MIESEDDPSGLVQLPSGSGLKLKFNLKPRNKSEAYSKLDENNSQETTKQSNNKSSSEIVISCTSCRNKDTNTRRECERRTATKCNFNDIPSNICDDIKTVFDDIENDDVCKSLPTDTFEDLSSQDTFKDIEVAIEDDGDEVNDNQ